MNNIKTGSFISALRKSKGLTQQDLSIELGVTSKTVSKWECGDALPEIQTLVLMSDFFDVTVDEILKGEKTRPSRNLTQDTETRFQTKKDRFIKQKLLSKITILYWISIGLLIAGLIFLGLFAITPYIVLLIFGVIFILSSVITFIIINSSQVYEDDNSMNRDIFISMHAKKFYFQYLYYNIILMLIFLVPTMVNTIQYMSLYFFPVYLFLSFIIYCFIRYKRYNYPMPKNVERIIYYNTRFNLVYLLVGIAFIYNMFTSSIYSYTLEFNTHFISFFNILLDQPIFLIVIFSVLFVSSIMLYIFGQYKHKTYNVEWIMILILSTIAYMMSISHYQEKMDWLRGSSHSSYGYSSASVEHIVFSILMALIYFISIPVIKRLSRAVFSDV